MIGEDIIEEEEEDYDQFSLTESSTVVEKFIRVIESSSNSKFENTTATTNSSNNSEIAASNTNREDIRRKLAFNKPEPTSFEAKAKSNKKNDLEGGLYRTVSANPSNSWLNIRPLMRSQQVRPSEPLLFALRIVQVCCSSHGVSE